MDSERPVSSRSRWVRDVLLATAILGVLVLLLLPAIQSTPDGHSRRSACVNNLKQFGIALHNYHDEYKSFPPAFIADAEGKPMHSWRVLLLPFFEEAGLKELYRRYDFSEPWNGPSNSQLADKMPSVYRCPSAEKFDNEPSYLAVVGPETSWPNDKTMSLKKFRDGTSRTIALVECVNSGINWLEPRDLTFEQAIRGINPKGAKPSISSTHANGVNVLFVDGAVHYLSDDLPADVLRGLLTGNGGEDVSKAFE